MLFDRAVMLEKAVGKRKDLLDRAHHKAAECTTQLLRLQKVRCLRYLVFLFAFYLSCLLQSISNGNTNLKDAERQKELDRYVEKHFEADDANLALEQAKICFEAAVEEYCLISSNFVQVLEVCVACFFVDTRIESLSLLRL